MHKAGLYYCKDKFDIERFERVSGFSAKPNSEVEVTFNSAPPEIILRLWSVGDSVNDTTIKFDSSKKVNNITLPDKKGEYIYEMNGYWSERNYTSTIFRIIIE
ncbi:NUDIX hydrolase N-terminal domain-containing protein [Clostridium tertium]|uniref:NUDIX hydrolase N-terminal domain-containing protein n=1 Tax=Clostridium tertium TaxID=1559 RepID=UPI001FA8C2E5|nr:NUDIX hydrolase N-terminal domain-containing protein [Clostridium tertium]